MGACIPSHARTAFQAKARSFSWASAKATIVALLLQVTRMTALAVLNLCRNHFSPEGDQDVFAPLAGLESLRELYLESCTDMEAPDGILELDHPGLEVGTAVTLAGLGATFYCI